MWNEYGKLKTVAVRSPTFAYVSNAKIDNEWRELRFKAAPDINEALLEHRLFVAKLHSAKVVFLPGDDALTLDSIYVRDAALATPEGIILCRMGRSTRCGEPEVDGEYLKSQGHEILGKIEAPGTLEGGDFIWLDDKTAAVGLGTRTNEAGIEQLKGLLGPDVEVHIVPLPAPDHAEDVFHLMSMISPVDKDLAVIYRPLMPDSFMDWLTGHGIALIGAPEAEYQNMACNVLALGPRQVLMLDHLPETRELLEIAGCAVETYKGDQISRKGDGGPTCLTRPLLRE